MTTGFALSSIRDRSQHWGSTVGDGSGYPAHGGNLRRAATQAGCRPEEILDFSANINPLGPPASALQAMQQSFSDLCHYPDPDYGLLRQAIGQFHQLDAAWVLPGNGAAELLTLAARDLTQTTRQTVVLTPAFGEYCRTLSGFQATIVRHLLPLQPDTLVPELPVSPLPQSGLLLNNPHNPTGRLFSRQAVLPLLTQYDLVVIDEAFMDFLPPAEEQSLIPLLADFPNLVIIRSLTKFYSLPGLRLGYALAHPDRLQGWRQWQAHWSVNTLAAAAGVAMLQDREFQQQTWQWLATARDLLHRDLAHLPGISPIAGVANFLLVQSQHPVATLQEKLLCRHRILIRGCHSFPELGDTYFRVAVRTIADNQRLVQALQAVLQSR